jgi:hypothetical protein
MALPAIEPGLTKALDNFIHVFYTHGAGQPRHG